MGEYLVTFEPLIRIVHFVAIVVVVVAILLQSGKGMNVGSIFGGGSQSLFGARGAGNFLTKVTSVFAILFLITSLTLATVANHKAQGGAGESVIQNEPVVTETQKTAEVPAEKPVVEEVKPEAEAK